MMGLDMYAWAVDPSKLKSVDDICPGEFKLARPRSLYKPDEIHYWRKHHDLHGWMQRLYDNKGGTDVFNCIKVRLEEEDLDQLEQDVINNKLPKTNGFLFGNHPSDEETMNGDLLFIAKARMAIKEGKAVYYDSWW